tara:strand:+ start:8674 stop:9825 length:1152 start_codon:yes stop_codon:yes gene_type:complete
MAEPYGQLSSILQAPQVFSASDYPWDHGDKINLKWTLLKENNKISFFVIEQSNSNKDGTFKQITKVDSSVNKFIVQDLDRNSSYHFQIRSGDRFGNLSKPKTLDYAVTPKQDWFDGRRFPLFLITFIFSGSVVFWIIRARSGESLKIRKIAGLEAVDEAVGRATEMGQPILFVPGIQDINEIQTIAGLTVLSRVSKVAAEYDAKVEVPTSKSLVMTAARETIQASFLSAGRPESYNQDLVYYVTDEQFGYVAYVQGMMVREKPAACFYMGAFFAESLILAETGNTIGAIQVAGTAMPAQLPFFVAACDYTLIGEEFFAASAYLSGEPDQLGSLKGQDLGKVIVGIGIVVGVTLLTLGTIFGEDTLIGGKLLFFAEYLKSTILT